MTEIRLSKHAQERAREMGVQTDEVVAAVADPVLTYPALKYPDCSVAVRGRLAVPFDPVTMFVITVLWHSKEER